MAKGTFSKHGTDHERKVQIFWSNVYRQCYNFMLQYYPFHLLLYLHFSLYKFFVS